MIVVIAGGREFSDKGQMQSAILKHSADFQKIISGGASGADSIAKKLALEWHFEFEEYPANWDAHGKAAGPIRNSLMAERGDSLIAFWDGKSRGTKNMIDQALKKGLEVHVYRYDGS